MAGILSDERNNGDVYRLRIGILPEEGKDELLCPYISVFAVTHEAESTSNYICSSMPPLAWMEYEDRPI